MFPNDPSSDTFALTGPFPTSVLDAPDVELFDGSAPFNDDFRLQPLEPSLAPLQPPKKEEPIDLSFLENSLIDATIGGLKDEWRDESLLEDIVPFIPEEAWAGTEGLMTAVLGQKPSLSGITLNDDVFMVANKEAAVSVYPVRYSNH